MPERDTQSQIAWLIAKLREYEPYLPEDFARLEAENAALRERLADCIREATEEVAQERRRADASEQHARAARAIIERLAKADPAAWGIFSETGQQVTMSILVPGSVQEQARAWLADHAEQHAAGQEVQ